MDKGYCKARAGKPVKLAPLLPGIYTGYWVVLKDSGVCMWEVDMKDNRAHSIMGEYPEYYEGVQGL